MSETPAAAPPTQGGAQSFGNYTLLRKLGQGGMAEIYLALRTGLGIHQLVVLKRIRTDQMGNDELVTMFLDEARIAATLNHTNIAQIHEIGEVEGRHYLAMEYLHGADVRGLCRALAKARRPLPQEQSLNIVAETAAGLHYAHCMKDLHGKPMKIIHRDVSPQNIFVTFEGAVKLLDFGIAKAENRAVETRSGVLKGKLTYMSPEQVQGGQLTPASDVFALAIVLWELTTGKRLFKADTDYAVLRKIVDKEIPAPRTIWPDYSAKLEDIVLTGLARDPAQRFQTARELQAALRGFMRGEQMQSGALELSGFMQSVFTERLASEKAALEEGRELYEVLRDRDASESGSRSGTPSQLDLDKETVASTPDGPAPESSEDLPEPTRVTVSADSLTGLEPAPKAPKSRSLFVVAGVGLAIVALAAVGGIAFMSNGDADEADETTLEADDSDEARADTKKAGGADNEKDDTGTEPESDTDERRGDESRDTGAAAGKDDTAGEDGDEHVAARPGGGKGEVTKTGAAATAKAGRHPKSKKDKDKDKDKKPSATSRPLPGGVSSDFEDPFGE